MERTEAKPAVGQELQAMTADTGAAMVGCGARTFVVVEVEEEPVQAPSAPYVVTDPTEVLMLRESAADTYDSTHTTQEAKEHLRWRQASRKQN